MSGNNVSSAKAWLFSYLSAECSRGLLSSTLPCSVWTINVVESSNTALKREVSVVVLAQFLRCELLQPICILVTVAGDCIRISKQRKGWTKKKKEQQQ